MRNYSLLIDGLMVKTSELTELAANPRLQEGMAEFTQLHAINMPG